MSTPQLGPVNQPQPQPPASASWSGSNVMKHVSTTAKIFLLAILLLLLMLPLSMVRELLHERKNYRATAQEEVAQGWGGEQTITPPALSLLAERTRKRVVDEKEIIDVTVDPILLLPSNLDAQATLATSVRSIAGGLYQFPVYTAKIEMSGRFAAADLAKLGAVDGVKLNSAALEFFLRDLEGVASIDALRLGSVDLQPASMGTALNGINAIGTVLSSPTQPELAQQMLSQAIAQQSDLSFTLNFTLRGSQSLRLLPMARSMNWRVRGAWPDPSFLGGLLPSSPKVEASGFDAQWAVSEFNRNFPQISPREADTQPLYQAAPIVRLMQLGDVYAANDRVGKYGALFLLLTFAGYFLVEALLGIRLHPMHYLQIGLALGLFFLLLLALSEQIGFAYAYLLAALGISAQIGGYTVAVLRSKARGFVAFCMMVSLYGFLYFLISGKNYSLVFGALGLFVMLSVVMYLTRNLAWGNPEPDRARV
jgi:inner membrane protein